MTKAQKADQAEAVEYLRKLLKPGDTVYTTLAHVSRSGMSRQLRVSAVVEYDGKPITQNITGFVARACGFQLKRGGWQDTLVVGGCGFDAGFKVAYSLGRALFPNDGFKGGSDFLCVGKPCPSNDHSNGDRNYDPHAHSDGGYALRHAWL